MGQTGGSQENDRSAGSAHDATAPCITGEPQQHTLNTRMKFYDSLSVSAFGCIQVPYTPSSSYEHGYTSIDSQLIMLQYNSAYL